MKYNVVILYKSKVMKNYIRYPFCGTDREINKKLAELFREGFIVNVER